MECATAEQVSQIMFDYSLIAAPFDLVICVLAGMGLAWFIKGTARFASRYLGMRGES